MRTALLTAALAATLVVACKDNNPEPDFPGEPRAQQCG